MCPGPLLQLVLKLAQEANATVSGSGWGHYSLTTHYATEFTMTTVTMMMMMAAIGGSIKVVLMIDAVPWSSEEKERSDERYGQE